MIPLQRRLRGGHELAAEHCAMLDDVERWLDTAVGA
jgi:hypothetical protein